MLNNRITVLCAVLFMSLGIKAQPWMESMFNENETANFYTIKAAYEDYWKDKDQTKIRGWKQYKRWEWYWQDRVDKEGNFLPAGITKDEYNKYVRAHKDSNRDIQANWQSVGPSTSLGGYAGLGRIASVAFHPTNTDIIYAGAAGGGLWKTVNGGLSWVPLSDNLGCIGASAILVDPVDPDIIYLGTGDGDASDSYSVGVLKSMDGGATFATTGLNWANSYNKLIRRMVFDPDNNNTIIAATSDGIWRTTNAGVSWVKESSGNFFDVEPNPDPSTNTFYAVDQTKVYKSTNNGDTWSSIYTISGSNRLSLAVTPANSAYVYVISSLSSNSGFKGLYRSINSGGSFSVMSTTPNILGWEDDGSDTGGQGWYDLTIAGDPDDQNSIYIGGVNHWKSIDGGASWVLQSHWYGQSNIAVHADKHVLEWQGNFLWEGNDGGLYRSIDKGDTWVHMSSTMAISQMYKLSASQTDGKVITGLQDNGTKLLNNNGTWSDVYGGDGMDCAINPSNASVMYAETPYGGIVRSTNGGAGWTNIQANISGNPSGAWVTPFILDPSNPTHIYAGYSNVYKSTNQGNAWTTIGTGLGSNKSHIAISPSNNNYIYTGYGDVIWRTSNGGSSWTQATTPLVGAPVGMIVVHSTNPSTIWAVLKNYTSGQKVFKSTNEGTTWTNVSGSLPNIPANCIIYQNGSSNGLYVGMDIGVYYKDDNMADWDLFSTALPEVEITDLDINVNQNTLYAATYGRGLWKTDLNGFVPSCLPPAQLTLVSLEQDAISFDWQTPSIGVDGYQWAVTTSLTPPASGTTTTDLSITKSGLSSNTNYYIHVRSACPSSIFSTWVTLGPIRTLLACGNTFYDSGGSNASYQNNENYTWTVCPSESCKAVKATFTTFSVENQWDALYVYNGDDETNTLFSSGNGVTLASFPAGGYYGTSIPGPFTSTHESGCLTFKFLSDLGTTGAGWAANLTCILKNPLVTNTNDGGVGSLREAIDCVPSGTTITFNPSLVGQHIDLTSSTLNISKNINIYQLPVEQINIRALTDMSIFTVQPTHTLNLRNVHLYPFGMSIGRGILNNGTLTLDESHLHEQSINLGSGSSIHNNGTIQIIGHNSIVKE